MKEAIFLCFFLGLKTSESFVFFLLICSSPCISRFFLIDNLHERSNNLRLVVEKMLEKKRKELRLRILGLSSFRSAKACNLAQLFCSLRFTFQSLEVKTAQFFFFSSFSLQANR